ncbi:MAG: chemotaxis protein CheW [Burkholderiales bacterium]|nr:chemotaxis protein CheW [Burkholderiales bacterium]
MDDTNLADALVELRGTFDDAFAHPYSASAQAVENILAIRVRDDAYALRLTEIAGLVDGRTIVPVPSPLPALLGVVGVRGQVVPVYDLGFVLGYAPATTVPRWMVQLRQDEVVAVAFDAFEAQQRLTTEAGETEGGTLPDSATGRHLAGVARTDRLRPILDLASVYEAVRRLADEAKAGQRGRVAAAQ